MDTEKTADAVSEGAAPAPVEAEVKATPQTVADPVEVKVKELLAKEREAIVQEAMRLGQSGKDKRLNALQRELQEEKARRIALEGALNTIPNQFGPDVDPMVRQQAQLAALQGQVGYYRTRDQQLEMQRREQEAKQAVFEATRAEVEALGLDPNDSRLEFDLDAPDADTFRRKAFASVKAAQKADRDKEKAEMAALIDKKAAEIEEKVRKATGVDSHDSGVAAGGKPVYTRDQFLDRNFYKANREDMDKAAREGRVQ